MRAYSPAMSGLRKTDPTWGASPWGRNSRGEEGVLADARVRRFQEEALPGLVRAGFSFVVVG